MPVKNPGKIHFYGTLIICSAFLLLPAYYNHYPLVNPDTGTHLASGFKPETPMDRPITYGLFARLFSINGLSLWTVVFAQAYLVSWLIAMTIKKVLGEGAYIKQTFFVIFFLSLFTTLPWFVCHIQPDMFTAIAVLCIALVLLNDTKQGLWLLYTLFLLAAAMHMSHPLLLFATLFCLLIAKWLFAAAGAFEVKKLAILAVLSLAGMSVMGPALSKSKHVFVTAMLLDKGILKRYLNDSCGVKNYKICAYKDALPNTLDSFIWDDASPLYKIGSWKGTKEEFSKIDHDIFTTPAYVKSFIGTTARRAALQLTLFNVGEGNFSFPPGSNVNGRIAGYFPRELRRFNESRQNTNTLGGFVALCNFVYTIVVVLSVLALAYMMLTWRKVQRPLQVLLIVCLTGVVINSLDCAAFSVTIGRYGAKIIWLIPFCAVLFIMQRFLPRRPG